jgi:hypothetical protein
LGTDYFSKRVIVPSLAGFNAKTSSKIQSSFTAAHMGRELSSPSSKSIE